MLLLAIFLQLATSPMTHTLLPLKAICMCGTAHLGLTLVRLLALKARLAYKAQLARLAHKAFRVKLALLDQLVLKAYKE